MPLTEAQRQALPGVRAMFNSGLGLPLGTAQSVDERARLPDPGVVPSDIAITVEIAPPSPSPHPLLAATGAPRTPERIPIFFFTFRGDKGAGETEATTVDADTRVLFFIHGGGDVVGHPAHHEPFVTLYAHLLRSIAAQSSKPKCILVAPSYRLATVPENAFPAALQDLIAAYDHIIAKGYNPENVIFAGDSAGGNHALVLTHLVLQSGKPPPHGVVLIAPFSIKTFTDDLSESAKELANSRDIIDVSLSGKLINAYVGNSGMALADPLVSGSFIPFTPSWPKTLILVGSWDNLIDASRELDRRLRAIKRPVELVEYDERPHGWWVLPHIFAEDIQDAGQRIAQFVLN